MSEEMEFVAVTQIEAKLNEEGDGLFEVKIDVHHEPEALGGLIGQCLIEAAKIFALRGMTEEEAMGRIGMGMQSVYANRSQIIQTGGVVQ